jgi:hypothetical protein
MGWGEEDVWWPAMQLRRKTEVSPHSWEGQHNMLDARGFGAQFLSWLISVV